MCPHAWELCVCIGGMLGDEVGSVLLSRRSHYLGTFDPLSCRGNYTRLAQVNLPLRSLSADSTDLRGCFLTEGTAGC